MGGVDDEGLLLMVLVSASNGDGRLVDLGEGVNREHLEERGRGGCGGGDGGGV